MEESRQFPPHLVQALARRHPHLGFGPVGVFALFGHRWYTGAMTTAYAGKAPRQSFFSVETGDGYRLEFTTKGLVDTDAETFLSEILAIAAHVFNDVFAGNFDEAVMDTLDYKFRARLEDEARPSEFDLGWSAGRQSAFLEAQQDQEKEEAHEGPETMVGKFLDHRPAPKPVKTQREQVVDLLIDWSNNTRTDEYDVADAIIAVVRGESA